MSLLAVKTNYTGRSRDNDQLCMNVVRKDYILYRTYFSIGHKVIT